MCGKARDTARQGVFADLGHEHAVYNVIKGLDSMDSIMGMDMDRISLLMGMTPILFSDDMVWFSSRNFM